MNELAFEIDISTQMLDNFAKYGDFQIEYHGISDTWSVYFVDDMDEYDRFISNDLIDIFEAINMWIKTGVKPKEYQTTKFKKS
jgi:hypothetical protein